MIVCRKYMFTCKILRSGQKAAVVTNRVVNLESVLATQVEIVLAMAGSRMHRTGTGIEGDVVAALAEAFVLSPAQIRDATQRARSLAAGDGRADAVSVADLRAACRRLAPEHPRADAAERS